MVKRQEPQHPSDRPLKGWAEIARYLGQPVSAVQRWAETGMPVRRSGRYVMADQEELDRWLESSLKRPAHIAHAGEADLVGNLREGLRAVRSRK